MDNTTYNGVTKGVKVKLPTKYGNFQLVPFQDNNSGVEHIAIIKGNPKPTDVVLTRLHSSCATGDLFGSLRCDCGDQLEKALMLIENEGTGVIIYLQQEGRGIGLMNKMEAYKLQEEGLDTVDANTHLGFAPDERNYKVGADMLKAINVNRIKLLTNNPAKVNGLEQYGIEVTQMQPLIIEPNKYNSKYLKTKQLRMDHVLNFSSNTL